MYSMSAANYTHTHNKICVSIFIIQVAMYLSVLDFMCERDVTVSVHVEVQNKTWLFMSLHVCIGVRIT